MESKINYVVALYEGGNQWYSMLSMLSWIDIVHFNALYQWEDLNAVAATAIENYHSLLKLWKQLYRAAQVLSEQDHWRVYSPNQQ